ncbi:hypothetical protein RchiOBHm_Chr4g0442591 [Rosa chinensis]|uniref:Uncharacterized protein n=1 Tax=Rosa chinensis TaxID=74649 RepID=A0A2P6R3M9_ROSCH|nr:hypothetical protein RchiOBHm_Chr4g0442591 [Rosa chinensis]
MSPICSSSVLTLMTIEMMKLRHKVERKRNIGEELGWSKNEEDDIEVKGKLGISIAKECGL